MGDGGVMQEIDTYTNLGWRVLLLQPGLKIPLPGSRGVHDATDSAAHLIERYRPGMNIGIALGPESGLIAIDIDPRNGGFESLKALAARGRRLPPTVMSETAQGGRHLLYRWPLAAIKNSKSVIGAGIDVKSRGGYIVAPPSVLVATEGHAAGAYRWLSPPGETEIVSLPEWLFRAMTEPSISERALQASRSARERDFDRRVSRHAEGAERRLEALARALATASVGARNNRLNHAAYLMARAGLSPALITATLQDAARIAGLDSREIGPTIASGIRAGSVESQDSGDRQSRVY